MHPTLNTVIVQFDIRWHQKEANCQQIDELLQADSRMARCDLVVLPEMFNSGFTMEAAAVAESMQGPTVRWMSALAARVNAVVTGTLVIGENQAYYNRLIWAAPDGSVQHYDKRHLFRMADEHKSYRAGQQRPIFTLGQWRIRPIICYDLRFPVWCRAQENNYDVLLCPANWPSSRHQAWVTLLHARALENQCYVLAANRVGDDHHGKHYLGSSLAIDAKGNAFADGHDKECLVFATLNLDELADFRQKFPLVTDADQFTIG